jgi:hypothetical protein
MDWEADAKHEWMEREATRAYIEDQQRYIVKQHAVAECCTAQQNVVMEQQNGTIPIQAARPRTRTEAVTEFADELALLIAAKQAKETYPTETARIDAGVALVITGGVELVEGTRVAIVRSEHEAGKQYRVNGVCNCPDSHYRAPDGRCKHRWAKALYIRARREGATWAVYGAQYEAPSGECVMGTACWVPAKGAWAFVPEDGREPLYPAIAMLTLLGRLDLSQTQARQDQEASA